MVEGIVQSSRLCYVVLYAVHLEQPDALRSPQYLCRSFEPPDALIRNLLVDPIALQTQGRISYVGYMRRLQGEIVTDFQDVPGPPSLGVKYDNLGAIGDIVLYHVSKDGGGLPETRLLGEVEARRIQRCMME
jgi:hypothetical protein